LEMNKQQSFLVKQDDPLESQEHRTLIN
jgi:hypothetical protein